MADDSGDEQGPDGEEKPHEDELWDDIAFVLEDEDDDEINEQEQEIDEYLQNLEDDEVPPENLWDELDVQMQKRYAEVDEDGNPVEDA